MLIRLLRTHLRPYRGPIALIVALQFLQTLATLYLPKPKTQAIEALRRKA